jgi:hypothetical protein
LSVGPFYHGCLRLERRCYKLLICTVRDLRQWATISSVASGVLTKGLLVPCQRTSTPAKPAASMSKSSNRSRTTPSPNAQRAGDRCGRCSATSALLSRAAASTGTTAGPMGARVVRRALKGPSLARASQARASQATPSRARQAAAVGPRKGRRARHRLLRRVRQVRPVPRPGRGRRRPLPSLFSA